MQTIRIKSLTDIITNSSTEVFTVYDDKAVQNIKNLVNSILALNNDTSDLTFDDIFLIDILIEWEYNDDFFNEYIEHLRENEHKEEADELLSLGNDNNETINNFLKEKGLYNDAVQFANDKSDAYHLYRYADSISIMAKPNTKVNKKKLDKAVELLNHIDSIFEQYARYC